MPAKSKAQQKAAGAALAAKRGETPVSKLKGASKGMYQSMSEKHHRTNCFHQARAATLSNLEGRRTRVILWTETGYSSSQRQSSLRCS